MDDPYKRTRRDDLRDSIAFLRRQVRDLVDRLRIAREEHKDFSTLGARHRLKAAERIVALLDERDYLEKDLADRLREFRSLPMSPSEYARIESEIASIDADLEYFQQHIQTLQKLRVNLAGELQNA